MRVACSRCQTRYDVPGDRLAQGAVKVRCSECGNVFVVRKRAAPPPEAEPPPEGEPQPSPEAAPPPEAPAEEAKFEDFDFASFNDSLQDGAELEGGTVEFEADGDLDLPAAEDAVPGPEEDISLGGTGLSPPGDEHPVNGAEDGLPNIGELDLGDFEGLDDDLNLDDLEDLDLGRSDDDLELPEISHGAGIDESMERVREEDLLGAPAPGARVQGLSDDMPRLDIQKGPRRAEGSSPSPVLPRDRRHSPLLWAIIAVAVATLGFTGFMLYTQRDAAFTFLNPDQIRTLWRQQTASTRLEAVDQRGFYKDLPAGRRMFVIQGSVVNRSEMAQSLIKVRGQLFGPHGENLASREVFCGNVLNEHELATLPVETIEARLQNEVGEGLSNVDIAPSSQVPFMVVFPSPPDGVEKFNISVMQAQTGADN